MHFSTKLLLQNLSVCLSVDSQSVQGLPTLKTCLWILARGITISRKGHKKPLVFIFDAVETLLLIKTSSWFFHQHLNQAFSLSIWEWNTKRVSLIVSLEAWQFEQAKKCHNYWLIPISKLNYPQERKLNFFLKDLELHTSIYKREFKTKFWVFEYWIGIFMYW